MSRYSRRGRPLHRVDATAKALREEATRLGARFLPHDGSIDGTLEYGGKFYLVDFKSPGATLTESQAKLVAAGWRIEFISTPEQLQRFLREVTG